MTAQGLRKLPPRMERVNLAFRFNVWFDTHREMPLLRGISLNRVRIEASRPRNAGPSAPSPCGRGLACRAPGGRGLVGHKPDGRRLGAFLNDRGNARSRWGAGPNGTLGGPAAAWILEHPDVVHCIGRWVEVGVSPDGLEFRGVRILGGSEITARAQRAKARVRAPSAFTTLADLATFIRE